LSIEQAATLVVLHGPPACGKYTIGKLVADDLDVAFFHNHLTVDLVGALFDFGSKEFIELREELWLRCFRSAVDAGRSLVFTFAPEATVGPEFIDQAREAVTAAGGAIQFVALTCPDEVIEQRLVAKDRAKFGKLRSLDLYRELRDIGALEYPPLPEPLLTIPTDRLSPVESAERIVEAVLTAATGREP
jgi:hypothetical protein